MSVSGAELQPVVEAVRSEAFSGLLRGTPVTPSGIAARRGVPVSQVATALERLEAEGAAEVLADGRIIGAHGLTLRPTAHTIDLDGRPLNTWCALDAVGIPVALGLDAGASTTCPTCGAQLAVSIRGGRSSEVAFVLWLPAGPCSNLMQDFCSSANLFCDAVHADAWRQLAGDPPGRVVRLPEVEEIARMAWADVADVNRSGRATD